MFLTSLIAVFFITETRSVYEEEVLREKVFRYFYLYEDSFVDDNAR